MAQIERECILDLLSSLAAKSFVTFDADAPGGGRYWMLQTVRQYAQERLAESGETRQCRERHTAHFLALAEEAWPHLTGPQGPSWLDLLDVQHDNLRAALGSCAERFDTTTGLRLTASLWKFWAMRWHLSEGRVFVEAALKASDGSAPYRAEAALGAGCLAWMQGDYGTAWTYLQESLSLGSAAGDLRMVAVSRLNLGNVALCLGEYDRAQDCYTACLDIRRRLGDPNQLAAVLHNLGDLARLRGDYPGARRFYSDSLGASEESGDGGAIAGTRNSLALIACLEGDDDGARSHIVEALTLATESWDRRMVAEGLEVVAILAGRREMMERAATLWGAAEAIRNGLGTPLPPARRDLYGRLMRPGRDRTDAQAWAAAWQRGETLTWEEAAALAREEAADGAG